MTHFVNWTTASLFSDNNNIIIICLKDYEGSIVILKYAALIIQ